MILRVTGLALVALALTACGGVRTVTRTVGTTPAAGATPLVQSFYGRIVSLTPSGGGYLMRFDPAFWLSGIAANAAAAHAQHVICAPAKCPPVANDHAVVDEGHGALVFDLPADTRGTVLTPGSNLRGTGIDAAQLATLVAKGKQARLFEPLDSGMWIRVRIDRVESFAQQYVP